MIVSTRGIHDEPQGYISPPKPTRPKFCADAVVARVTRAMSEANDCIVRKSAA